VIQGTIDKLVSMKIFNNESIDMSEYNTVNTSYEDISEFSLDLLRRFYDTAYK